MTPPNTSGPTPESETWEVGWGKGLTGPNMAAFCVYDFQRNKAIPVRCGMRLVAVVPTSESNRSNLIAAAPDMLAALKVILPFLKNNCFIEGVKEMLEQAEAAISKAEATQ